MITCNTHILFPQNLHILIMAYLTLAMHIFINSLLNVDFSGISFFLNFLEGIPAAVMAVPERECKEALSKSWKVKV